MDFPLVGNCHRQCISKWVWLCPSKPFIYQNYWTGRSGLHLWLHEFWHLRKGWVMIWHADGHTLKYIPIKMTQRVSDCDQLVQNTTVLRSAIWATIITKNINLRFFLIISESSSLALVEQWGKINTFATKSVSEKYVPCNTAKSRHCINNSMV